MMRRTFSLLSWRDQGISYVRYLNVTTETLHSAVAPQHKAKYTKYSTPGYVATRPDGTGAFEKITKVPSETTEY